VDPQHGLAGGSEGVGQEQLGHDHALEHVGGLADHDSVDVGPGKVSVFESALGGLPDQAHLGHVDAFGVVLGLSDSDHGTALTHRDASRSRTQTRFCWRQGPDVAWATARAASPS
jgi:hypothetical protein